MAPLIQAAGLSRHFNGRPAVDRLTLAVEEGEVVALLGHNGAGKTTTVRMLTALLRPTAGQGSVAGLDVVRDAPRVRRIVGILTETPGLYSRMRAAEYLDFFGELYGMPAQARRERAARLLAEFDLADSAGRRLSEFSKGMRQKVALIRAMFHSPRALFLDEPSSGLDPHSSKQVRDAVTQLRRQGLTILLCTHNLFEAETLSSRIAIIGSGRLLALGTAEELKRRYLGAPLMEVRLAQPLRAAWPELHGLMTVEAFGDTYLRYRAARPEVTNPALLRKLDELEAQVVTISHAPQSLEQVYLKLTGGKGTSLAA